MDAGGFPVAVCRYPAAVDPGGERQGRGHRKGRRRGEWVQVEGVLDRWRVDEDWWRSPPIQRLYYRVVLSTGAVMEIYRDLVDGRWYQQRYGP